ncbi:MAG TPA: hypothetical protein VMU81_27400 [Acetobacteraceae bacterium]|nr:hypothetical protein [Acetobacteraceae bacterium]
MPLSDDPDLHLLCDGRRIDAVSRCDAAHIFRLGRVPRSLRIRSHAAVPAELGVARDPRPLGVAVRQIELWQNAKVRVLPAEDAVLVGGFHDYEPDCGWRWTNGDAPIPAVLLAGLSGTLEVVVRVGSFAHYIATERRTA